ncbi:MAG: single-stranded DNA-binding protein [Bacteroidales bacterium]|jgi:single-strand DNA-binding protein|nr:single-stranded DNA-binding protein [Bacteroidales bacterium]MDD4216756.1 single-stranded DNA-binding protein [Bacteroidales bacterium]
MNLKNQVQLIGNVGSEPLIKEFNSGRKMARFSVATDDVKKVNGKFVKHTQWYNVTVWNKIADIVQTNINIGTEVIIQGRVVNNEFRDKQGTLRKISEIIAESLIYRNINSSIKENINENKRRA